MGPKCMMVVVQHLQVKQIWLDEYCGSLGLVQSRKIQLRVCIGLVLSLASWTHVGGGWKQIAAIW
jgi:hypothetical protein